MTSIPPSLPLLERNQRIGPCVRDKTCGSLSVSASTTPPTTPPKPARQSHPNRSSLWKANSAIIGPNDDVVIPKNAKKPDWEVELGVVIGKEARYIEEAGAMDHIAGYCVINDISERHFQTERRSSMG